MKEQFGSRVLEAWFRPAVSLMSRLTYVSKFAVATALFAVPLIVVVINATLEHDEKIEQLQKKYVAVERLDDVLSISRHLSRVRNSKTLSLLSSEPSADIEKNESAAITALTNLENAPSISTNNLIKLAISNLNSAIVSGGRVGSEGDSIYSAFDSANRVVKRANRLGQLIISEGGVLNDNDVLSLNVVSLLMNEMQQPLENFGKIESFGSFFLDKGFLDSQSVLVLSSVSNQLGSSYAAMNQQLKSIFNRFDSANQSTIIDTSLLESISRLVVLAEDSIVLDPDLETMEAEFRDVSQKELSQLNLFQDQLVDYLLHRYQFRMQELQSEQWKRSMAIGVLVFGALYLFMGIFFSVEHSLLQLIGAAKRVSSGDLDTKVEIQTRDELFQLACVFEEMRMQLKARDKALFNLAITDGLTGLFNRKYFNDCLALKLKESSRSNAHLTLLLIDIDFFKKLNDNYGHQVGDDCLIEMGKLLTSVLERETDMAFRYGGEEFAIILPNTSSENCLPMVKKIWSIIRASAVPIENEVLNFTASIGVSSTDTVASFEGFELIQAADQALYSAKDSGRDCFVMSSQVSHVA